MRSLWTRLRACCQLAARVQEVCNQGGFAGLGPVLLCEPHTVLFPCTALVLELPGQGVGWQTGTQAPGGPREICSSWLKPEESESIYQKKKKLWLSVPMCACWDPLQFCMRQQILCAVHVCPQHSSPRRWGCRRAPSKQRGKKMLSLDTLPHPMQTSLVLSTTSSCLSFSKHRGALSPHQQWVSPADSRFVD